MSLKSLARHVFFCYSFYVVLVWRCTQRSHTMLLRSFLRGESSAWAHLGGMQAPSSLQHALDPVRWNLTKGEATNLETSHAIAKITQPVKVVFLSAASNKLVEGINKWTAIQRHWQTSCLVSIALLSLQHDRVSRNLRKSERAARVRFN